MTDPARTRAVKPAPGNALASDLGAALDPAVFARRAGLVPEDWQAKILRSRHPRVALNVARQGGKSTLAAVLAVHEAVFEPGSLTLLLAPSLRQSQELFRKVLDVYKKLRPVPSEAETTLRLELESGSRIVALPGTEQTTRGFSAVRLLIFDEAARCGDDVIASALPMLDPSAGRVMFLSTAYGARGVFYEATRDPTWEVHTVPGTQVARLTPRFLAQQERALGRWWYDQEYLCQFLDPITSAFASEDIARAFSPEVKAWPLPSQWV